MTRAQKHERNQLIIADHYAGLSDGAIARKLNLDRSTVSGILRENKVRRVA